MPKTSRATTRCDAMSSRHGPGKTNIDVARELGQTHASVYRYFPSKAGLLPF